MLPPASSGGVPAVVAEWDVFLSYSRTDADKARLLARALRDEGLRVFLDDMAVDDFASITASISEALACSRTLLALYSAEYPRRRACQWELTYAYLAGQREGDPRRRVLVINPENSADHVHPVELRDAKHWTWPAVPDAALQRLSAQVAAHVAGIGSPLGVAGRLAGGHETQPVPWLPAPVRTGSARFTDRLAEQWRIHTALVRHRAPLVARPGSGSGRTAQLRGMPGIGKSVLAQEYALRFSPAYPGGVYWFDLHASQVSPTTAMDSYARQVAVVCHALDVDHTSQAPLAQLLSRLAVHLGERGAPCLWVVDGLPDGLHGEELQLLRGPHLLASTLLTTRSFRYGSFAEAIDLPPLSDADGYRLVTSHRAPESEVEEATALALVHDVGGHPLALDRLSDLAGTARFTDLRNRLHAGGADLLTFPGTPQDGHRPTTPSRASLASVLLTRPLSGNGPVDDVLRLLALASPAPLTRTVLENAIASTDPYDPWEAVPAVSEAIAALLGAGALLPDPAAESSWTVHALLARAVRRHDEDTARQEDLRRVLLHTLAAPPVRSAPETPPHRQQAGLFPPLDQPRPRTSPVERAAAFDLHVELVTRVGVQPLGPEDGSLREALTSLHSLFATTREVLHRVAGETPPPRVLLRIAFVLTNEHLRPFLAKWHVALRQHEDTCPPGRSFIEHERLWSRAEDVRAHLADLREPLTSAAEDLAALCGINLLDPAGPENP
ncbi:TIR domain-containing protein [Streptomyces sp. ID05-47C]|uniref:TIR domain-containing protein n=1 Tax=Streptomyces sp. ID05-47C TaxID=3028665 RepID=UPI00299FB175|nr:TIR domain-containing protein [Streptomyces sp. ID05-47C]MDX3571232.1 TIR domain-containing protein [Streptomyces sp. ID05-47C]